MECFTNDKKRWEMFPLSLLNNQSHHWIVSKESFPKVTLFILCCKMVPQKIFFTLCLFISCNLTKLNAWMASFCTTKITFNNICLFYCVNSYIQLSSNVRAVVLNCIPKIWILHHEFIPFKIFFWCYLYALKKKFLGTLAWLKYYSLLPLANIYWLDSQIILGIVCLNMDFWTNYSGLIWITEVYNMRPRATESLPLGLQRLSKIATES